MPKSLGLLLVGASLLGLGFAMGAAFIPINKNLWTPSYVFFTTGWALLFLAAFHAALDESPPGFKTVARRACLPLTIYGMNALFLFVCSGVVARLLQAVHIAGGTAPVSLKEKAFEAIATLPLSPKNASLAFALLFNLAMFAVAWVMWRKRWFVKV
jgi:predicted acyltransferase